MYNFSIFLHSWLRWAILIVGIIVVVKSFLAARHDKPYEKNDAMLSLVMMIACDIMLLVGWYQWGFGPMGKQLFDTLGVSEVMKTSSLRFFAIEHVVGMNVAIILVHVARVLVKNKRRDIEKHSLTWRFFAAILLLIIITIPWPFLEVGNGRSWFYFFD